MTQQELENKVVRGVVRAVEGGGALVEIAPDLRSLVPLNEFTSGAGVKPGDEVDVLVEELESGREPVLSKIKADQLRKWDAVVAAHAEGRVVEGVVVAPTKGGFSVDIGVRAFLPLKQAEAGGPGTASAIVGEKLQFQILKLEEDEAKVTVGRRALVGQERAARKAETLSRLKEGAVLPGRVKSVTDFGAFVDLGGIDGLVHVTELGWRRVGHPREAVTVGDEVTVKVLKLDPSADRVALSIKQAQPDPWADVGARFAPGARVKGQVTSLTDYGAFIAVEAGVEGLLHVSEMSWTKRVTHPSKVLAVGQEVEAQVLEVDPQARRLRLGTRQLTTNPWATLEQRFPIGTVIRGKIRSLTDFGVFVAVEDGIDGLVHVSDLSWTERIKDPSERYAKGQDLEVVVLDVDAENERLALGVKQLRPDPWSELATTHPIGTVFTGKVARLADFGAFVEVQPGIEGLVHISQLRDERVENIRDVVKEGDALTVKVIDLDPSARKVSLSVRAARQDAVTPGEEYDYRQTMRDLEKQGRASFADVLAGKVKRDS